MATLIFSLVFSFIPAIMIGKSGIGFGYAFLTYIFGVIFSFIGAKIGKFVRDFVGEIFISSTGGIVGLAIEKFNALYGTQISFFIVGLLLAFMPFSDRGKALSRDAKTQKAVMEKSISDVKNIEMIPFQAGTFETFRMKDEYYEGYDYSSTAFVSKEKKGDSIYVKHPSFAISRSPVTVGLYDALRGEKNPSIQRQKFGFVKAFAFCNELSIKHKLTPCYSFKGNTDTKKWFENKTTDEEIDDSIVCDFSANGYRLPTEIEFEKAYYGGADSVIEDTNEDIVPVSNPLNIRIDSTGRSDNRNLYLCWNWFSDLTDIYAQDFTAPDSPKAKHYKNTHRVTRFGYGRTGDKTYGYLFLCRTISDADYSKMVESIKKENERISKLLPKMIFVEGGTFEKRDFKNHTSEYITVGDFYISTEPLSENLLYEVNYEFCLDVYDNFMRQKTENDDSAINEAVSHEQYGNDFFTRLSVASGHTPYYYYSRKKNSYEIFSFINEASDGFRLPTEDELAYYEYKTGDKSSIKHIVQNVPLPNSSGFKEVSKY